MSTQTWINRFLIKCGGNNLTYLSELVSGSYKTKTSSIFTAKTHNDVIEATDKDENINEIENYGTPLYFACFDENLEVVDALLDHGADPILFHKAEKGPIQIAAERGNLKIVKKLLKAGVNIDNEANGTALYHACSKGHIDIIDYLIDQGADVNTSTKLICGTALMIACKERQIDAVQRLLDVGADVNIISSSGYNALTIACSGGSIEIFDKLIIYGASIDNPKCIQNPLVAAAKNGHIEIVQKLINLGIDINQQNKMQSMTPLMAAVAGGHTEIVKLLLDEDADMTLVDIFGYNVYDMHICSKDNYIKPEIKTLLDNHRIVKLMDACD